MTRIASDAAARHLGGGGADRVDGIEAGGTGSEQLPYGVQIRAELDHAFLEPQRAELSAASAAFRSGSRVVAITGR